MQFSWSFRPLLLGALAFVALTAANAADAADHPPIAVTRFDDPLPPEDCLPHDCSVREAIILANNLPGPDTVLLPPGTYDLTLGLEPFDFYEDEGYRGDMDVASDIVIRGSGVDETIITDPTRNGPNGPERVFEVLPGASLRVLDLTVSGLPYSFHPLDCGRAFWNRGGVLELERVKVIGNVMRGSGGGICNEEGGTLTIRDSAIIHNVASLFGQGGGIYNVRGSVTLQRVIVAGNWAYVFDGGGIYSNQGILVVRDSVIMGNETSPNAPFGPRRGGGIAAGGTVVLENVTIAGNKTEGTHALIGEKDSRGGGLYLWGEATLTNVTIAGNESETTAGGLYAEQGAQVTLTNTIIAGNTGGDCEGAVTSGGRNIDGDGSCGLTGPGDMAGADPMLAPLADNGGPTETQALLPGSPAIDAGDDAACPESDQRGAPRPSGAACDIGAFEAGGLVPTPPPPTPTASPPPPVLTGDADCSDAVNSVDALAVLRFTAGLGPYAECLFAANVNCNLQLEAVDALLILRHVAALPVGQPSGCPKIGPP